MDFKEIKIALVHDWLVGKGGGERVLLDIHEMFPEAPIYTLVYDEEKAPSWCKDCDIRTTYLQKIPGAKSHHKLLLSLMPDAWESVDLTEFDLVISSCMSCCKGVITRPDALHVCYCHTPTRYVWDLFFDYLNNAAEFKRPFVKSLVPKVRMWDYLAAQRVDLFVANSNFVGKRIRKYYKRDSVTIYPGVSENPNPVVANPLDYYFVVSRFVTYKRIDITIDACNRLGRRLLIVGSGGDEEKRLRQKAGPTVSFLGSIPDDEMLMLYSCAKAFLFPGMEDFGITPIEAMAAGVPVLAYAAGGALETVSDGETGRYFYEQTGESLADCILRFERDGVALSREEIRQRSERFSKDRFKREMLELIEAGLKDKVSQ